MGTVLPRRQALVTLLAISFVISPLLERHALEVALIIVILLLLVIRGAPSPWRGLGARGRPSALLLRRPGLPAWRLGPTPRIGVHVGTATPGPRRAARRTARRARRAGPPHASRRTAPTDNKDTHASLRAGVHFSGHGHTTYKVCNLYP